MFEKILDFVGVLTLLFLLAIVLVLIVVFGGLILVFQIPRHLILKPLKLNDYLKTMILALDSLGGSIVYGRRGRLFYISSISYYDSVYHKKNIWFRLFIDKLFFFDKEHTKESFLGEANRMCLVPELDKYGQLLKWDNVKKEVVR